MNKIKRFIIGGKFYNKKRVNCITLAAMNSGLLCGFGGAFPLIWALFIALLVIELCKPKISDYRYWIIRRKHRANLKAIKAVDDGYFKNVDAETIVELAKKSIRMTTDNCELSHKIEDLEEKIEELEQQNSFECGCVAEYKDKCKTLLNLVLSNKPELRGWAELHFKEFMVENENN